MESGEIICEDNWMYELDSEVAGGGEDSQQIQTTSKTQLSRRGRPVSEQPSGLLIGKDVLFGCERTQERGDL